MAYQLTDEDRKIAQQMAMQRLGQMRPQTQPQQSKKGFWTDQISTGGGIGGALGGASAGALAGTALFPGVGTAIGGLAGGILGGALGSGGGEMVENRITGDDLWKNVGKEAALGGVFSAPPIRLAKGVATGGAALLKGGGGSAAKKTLEQALTEPGMLGTALKGAGANLRAEGRGITAGARLGGERMGTQKVTQLNDFLDNTVKARGGTPVRQLRDVENFITLRSDQLTSAINQSNRVLTSKEKTALVKSLRDEFNKSIISPTSRQQGIFNDLVTRIQQTKDVANLDTLRKMVDDNINFARNAASPEPAAEQVFKMFRTGITDDVANKVGAAKGLKADLHKAFDSQEMLLNKAGGKWDFGNAPNLAGVPIPKFVSRAATSAANTGLSGAGSIAERLGGANMSLALRQGVGGLATSGNSGQATTLEDALTNYSPESADNTIATQYNTMNANTMPPAISNMDGVYQETPQMSSPYGRDNLLYDIQRDPANAQEYIQYYQMLQEVFAPVSTEPELTSTQATRAAAAQNALVDIPLLEEAISSGQLGGAKALPGAGTALGRRLLGTEDLDAALFNIADNILRARSGAAAPEAEVRRFVETFLPGPLDSEEAKRSKLQRAVRELQGYVNPTAAAAGTLEEVLTGVGGL